MDILHNGHLGHSAATTVSLALKTGLDRAPVLHQSMVEVLALGSRWNKNIVTHIHVTVGVGKPLWRSVA